MHAPDPDTDPMAELRLGMSLARPVAAPEGLREWLESLLPHAYVTPGNPVFAYALRGIQGGYSRRDLARSLALGLLRSEGLVVTGQGRGSFVADVPVATVSQRVGRLRHEVHCPDRAIEFDEGDAAEQIDVTVEVTAAPTTIAEAIGGRRRGRGRHRDRTATRA